MCRWSLSAWTPECLELISPAPTLCVCSTSGDWSECCLRNFRVLLPPYHELVDPGRYKTGTDQNDTTSLCGNGSQERIVKSKQGILKHTAIASANSFSFREFHICLLMSYLTHQLIEVELTSIVYSINRYLGPRF